MKIICKRIELVKALRKIDKIVGIQKGQPILSNILLEVNDNLVLKSRNLTSYLKLTVEGEVLKVGACCTTASKLIAAIESFSCEDLTLETNDKVFTVKGDDTLLNLELINSDYYPQDNLYEKSCYTKKVTLKNEELNKSIQKCIPFINDRGITSGINFNIKNKKLNISGCSSIAAGYACIDNIKAEEELSVNFTLSAKDATIITSIFTDEELTLGISDSYIRIDTSTDFLIINRMNGDYPNLENLLKLNFKYKLPINISKMEEAFNLIDIVSNSNIAAISYNKDICSITCNKLVNSNIKINGNIDIPEVEFGVNYLYLKKIFKAIDSNDVYFDFEEVKKPVLIKSNNCTFMLSLASVPRVDL